LDADERQIFGAKAPDSSSEEDDDESASKEDDVEVVIGEENTLCKLRINDVDKDHDGKWQVIECYN